VKSYAAAAGSVKTFGSTGRSRPGHNPFFQFVMYTTGMLRYACRQFVAQVT
jgi:hypothetical protein